MPQVVCNIERQAHTELVKRAKAARRTIGNQLLAEAFDSVGLAVPSYLNAAPQKRGKTIRKGEVV